jgi:hypothetical protein
LNRGNAAVAPNIDVGGANWGDEGELDIDADFGSGPGNDLAGLESGEIEGLNNHH